MKAAIIILGNSWVCPYVNTYRRILEKQGCVYDVILWDRDGSDAAAPIRYSSGKANLANPLVKAYHYLKYADFIKRTILENGYDRLVVSGPHLAILLSGVLRKKYKGRYIIDYRDISVEQHLLLGGVYSKVLESSFCNVISSPGFRKYLPAGYDYLISHNFSIDVAMESLKSDSSNFTKSLPLEILTVGYIRNYNSNVKVIQSLGGNADYSLSFVGRGDAAASLQEFAAAKGYANVGFKGFYKKEDEAAIVSSCDFINIFFPDDVEHSPIMSNRFYLALIYKKPMIVTEGSVQAALVKEYGLGVVTGDCSTLDADIREFCSAYNHTVFCNKCKDLLELFVEEYRVFEQSVINFLQ
ncbi:MAG: hypothetical protein IKW46_08590 [Bacteroidaceae bacterium]|nr:hypothetical protein [Bacteroidaceae bacterium]